MSHSINFQGFVGIGIKELSKTEFKFFCHTNKTNFTLDNLETKNKTEFTISLLYILLFIWTRYMDKKDELKKQIHLLAENENDDLYFYEILFYTGLSLNAGTESNVI